MAFVSNDLYNIFFKEKVSSVRNYIAESYILSSIWVSKHKRLLFTRRLSYILLSILFAGDIEMNPGPSPMFSELNNLLSFKGLSVVHQNIRGLLGKKDLIQISKII